MGNITANLFLDSEFAELWLDREFEATARGSSGDILISNTRSRGIVREALRLAGG
jgi:hypothetical protein